MIYVILLAASLAILFAAADKERNISDWFKIIACALGVWLGSCFIISTFTPLFTDILIIQKDSKELLPIDDNKYLIKGSDFCMYSVKNNEIQINDDVIIEYKKGKHVISTYGVEYKNPLVKLLFYKPSLFSYIDDEYYVIEIDQEWVKK